MPCDIAPMQRSTVIVLLPLVSIALGCSNILVSPGAAADGNSHISYNADDAALHGAVSHWPAAVHPEGSMCEVYSWDLGIKLGEIPQVPETANVMGNANEHGVVIGETTHGGLAQLSNVGKDQRNGTAIDYGSLIWITLQRAKSAREAIDVMTSLASTYGYASSMEGFSIADSNEVWYMEMIGKGNYGKGVVWVALRVPDGYISAHANQARITTFLPCEDSSTCRAAGDVVSFAVKLGLYPSNAPEADFSFSDVYDPVTFEGARFCEARVWYLFTQVADPRDFDSKKFLPYARGENLKLRMPLFVRPKNRLTRHKLHQLMGSHYEGSWFDPSTDVGAGAEHSPYRWNGLLWQEGGTAYVNERIVGTHYTGWHFVARVANDSVPAPMRVVQWWGADDHSYAPKIPLHGGATAVHLSYDDANCTARSVCRRAHGLPGTTTEFSWSSAWWVNNMVADTVMTREDRAAPIALSAREALEAELEADLATAERLALTAFSKGDIAAGVEALTGLAVNSGKKATEAWIALWQRLMVLFIDGRKTRQDDSEHVCGCAKDPAEFTSSWKAKVIADAGDKYRVPDAKTASYREPLVLATNTPHRWPGIPKMAIKGVF